MLRSYERKKKNDVIHSHHCRGHYDTVSIPYPRYASRIEADQVYDQVTNQGTFLFCDPTRESDFVIGQLISSTAESWLQVHGSTGYQSHIVLLFVHSNLSYIKVKRCTTDTVTLRDGRV